MNQNKPDSQINIIEIMKMIPHRYPFLLIDKVIEIIDNQTIIGIKNVTFNEPHFMGHFPDNPVMPGVLIIEALAQISAVLVAKTIAANTDEKQVYFMAIEGAKFRQLVRPGDSMTLKSSVTQHRGSVWKFSATAEVNNAIVAESDFMAMIKDKD